MSTNTKESGLESTIVNWLVAQNGFEQGANVDYNREYAVDEVCLFRFLESTQPEQMAKLGIRDSDLKRAAEPKQSQMIELVDQYGVAFFRAK
ncbi:MAG: hypothetical protein FWF87_07655 [Synergistaceae bacterium]|nr:hypothetical protein [Synergistaceae bacterium]